MASMYKKIVCALVIGCVITFFFAQFDQWTHEKVAYNICKSLQFCDCESSCTIESLNFFYPSLIISNLVVSPSGSVDESINEWSWSCERVIIEGSWMRMLFQGELSVDITLENFHGDSIFKNSAVSLISFLSLLMKKSVIPKIDIRSIVFKNGRMTIDNVTSDVNSSFEFNSSSFQSEAKLHTTCALYNGSVIYKGQEYVKNCSAHVTNVISMNSLEESMTSKVNGTMQLPYFDENEICYVAGELHGNGGRFGLRSSHNVFVIDPIIITKKELRVIADIPFSYIVRCLGSIKEDTNVSGNIHARFKMNTDGQQRMDGFCTAEDIVINKHAICDTGKILFTERDGLWDGKINCTQRDMYSMNFDISGKVQDSLVQGACSGEVTTKTSGKNHAITGTYMCENNKAIVDASLDGYTCAVTMSSDPYMHVQSCSYKDADKKELIFLEVMDDPKKVQGMIAFSFARRLMSKLFGYDLQGEGMLAIQGALLEDSIAVNVELADATIKIPSLYNCIDGFKADFSYFFKKRLCVVEDMILSLHAGTLCCPHAVIYFDPSLSVAWLHAPLLLDHCLLNIKKDLFASVSGALLCSKTTSYPRVEGRLLIDRAQLKENLLSGAIQKQLFSHTQRVFSLPDVPIECDLVLETTLPIRVDTSFLQTNAQVDLRLHKEYAKDMVFSGTVNLFSGSIVFPYKPLHITKGTLVFCPDQPFDPIIELTARNKIKKYDISLQVDGSLLSHNIMLDSTPLLTEEQIIALLLVGSEDNLLNVMMPALIVQNIKNFIFSSNQSGFFNSYFKPFMRPFSVNLIPSFIDQSGRGGLRGALELTIEDRWRVIIQKNFMLTEDTRFELEYVLSDDIMIRAIRDERRDVGGEVEMRWKF